jgi:hypothetical protein
MSCKEVQPSLSDHKHVLFSVVGEQEENVNYRDRVSTYWASSRGELQGKFAGFPVNFGTVEDIAIPVEFVQQDMLFSYETNCLLWMADSKKKVPCWGPQLGKLHKEISDIPRAGRLHKILSKVPMVRFRPLLLPSKEYTSSVEEKKD